MTDQTPTHRRLSIADLERILSRDDEAPISILPSGEVVELPDSERKPKVLTMRENLGGEYGCFPAYPVKTQ